MVGADLGASHGDSEGAAIPKRHEVGVYPLRPMLHPIVSAKAVLHPHGHPAQAQVLDCEWQTTWLRSEKMAQPTVAASCDI